MDDQDRQRHLTEHVTGKVKEDIKGQGRVIIDVCKFLDSIMQCRSGSRVSAQYGSTFLPKDWDKQGGIRMFATGIDVFDNILRGGQAPARSTA